MTPETLPTPLSAFISLEDLAATLGVTRPTIGAWRRERQLPAIRLGARTYFYIPSVAAWLKGARGRRDPRLRHTRARATVTA